MDLCNVTCSSVCPSVLHGKILKRLTLRANFKPYCFTSVMSTGTIEHGILLSEALTLAESHKVSRKYRLWG